MIHHHQLGKIPPKPHTAFYDENNKLLMEHCLTREGFEGAFSILYYRTPPTDENAVEKLAIPGFCPFERLEEQPLYRRHIKTFDLKLRGDFLDARRVLLFNADVQIGQVQPTEHTPRFFSNGDGDELYFVNKGSGRFETLLGVLPFREHDYVYVPRGIPYRIRPDDAKSVDMLVFEGLGFIDIPKEWRNRTGQITMYAPYTHRDFHLPMNLLAYNSAEHGKPPFKLVVKRDEVLTVHVFQHFPYDLAGWEGFVYPFTFNIHDYQPKTSTIHLPPTIHLTFAGNNFVVCSFVPRKVDYYHRDGVRSIPCPYGHASVHMDEILFYVEGNFTSRRGISPGSISLHPAGIPHGPHPGTYEKSIGVDRTSELAVMCDTYKQLHLTKVGHEIEDKDYHLTWVSKEAAADKPVTYIP